MPVERNRRIKGRARAESRITGGAYWLAKKATLTWMRSVPPGFAPAQVPGTVRRQGSRFGQREPRTDQHESAAQRDGQPALISLRLMPPIAGVGEFTLATT